MITTYFFDVQWITISFGCFSLGCVPCGWDDASWDFIVSTLHGYTLPNKWVLLYTIYQFCYLRLSCYHQCAVHLYFLGYLLRFWMDFSRPWERTIVGDFDINTDLCKTDVAWFCHVGLCRDFLISFTSSPLLLLKAVLSAIYVEVLLSFPLFLKR